MKKSLRSELIGRLRKETERLARQVLEDPSSDYESMIRIIGVYRTILKQMPLPWYRRLGLPFTIALICVTIVGFAMVTPRTPTKLTLSIESSGVQALLKSKLTKVDVHKSNLTGSLLTVNNVVDRRLPPLSISSIQAITEPSLFYLCSGQAIVDELSILPVPIHKNAEKKGDQQTLLEIQFHEQLFPAFSVTNGNMIINTRLSGDVRIANGSCGQPDGIVAAQRIDKQLAEPFSVTAKGEIAKPATFAMQLETYSQLVFRNFAVSDVRFIRRESTKTVGQHYVSTIKGGQLTLLDSDTTTVLSEDAFLNLEGFKGRIREMRINDRVSILMEGDAARVTLGPEGFEQDLTPTYMEYFYHHGPLSLLWTGLVFLWSLLWGGTILMAGEKK